MEEEICLDLLIDEIEKRDAIWNLNSKQYSNKIIKRRSWEELVLIFCNHDDSEEKKKNLGKLKFYFISKYILNHIFLPIKKWKNLRDSYVKEIKKTKLKSGSSASTTSTFAYLQRLSFLKPVLNKKITDNSLDNEETPVNVELNSMNNSASPTEKVPRKKYKLHPADEHFANIIEKSLNRKNEEERKEDDEDKLFCLSLVKEIKKVPDHKRLKLKIEMYNLLERYQSGQPVENYQSVTHASIPQTHSTSGVSQQYNNKPERHFRSYSLNTGSQYTDTLRFSAPGSSRQYGYSTASYISPASNESQATRC
ncbi:uncharacterized protein LOC133525331 [Cydia pomonella]|uniref:uncharacterized protein LOC133525331 n=1 Tax=Cydia pomonella TaxID=82600 RepID=UPI002ADDD88D|nr:uncharacterized protein LOC133525331 [Cydia pomonella]